MLNATHKLEGDLLRIELDGAIDETSDLAKTIGPFPATIEFNCRSLRRINSVGVRGWVQYFGPLRNQGVRLRFVECSPAVIACQNFVTNFMLRSEIVSLSVPFQCESCSREFSETVSVSDIVDGKSYVKSRKCPECGSMAELDEDERVYLSFLRNG